MLQNLTQQDAAAQVPLRLPSDFLAFRDIEDQYPNTAKAGTLYVWACTHRHNFHRLVTKVGSKSVVRRDRWEAFLEAGTIGSAERVAA